MVNIHGTSMFLRSWREEWGRVRCRGSYILRFTPKFKNVLFCNKIEPRSLHPAHFLCGNICAGTTMRGFVVRNAGELNGPRPS